MSVYVCVHVRERIRMDGYDCAKKSVSIIILHLLSFPPFLWFLLCVCKILRFVLFFSSFLLYMPFDNVIANEMPA